MWAPIWCRCWSGPGIRCSMSAAASGRPIRRIRHGMRSSRCRPTAPPRRWPGSFGARIRALEAEIVIDMISFTPASTRQIVEALRGAVGHFLHCGTIWVYGHNPAVPADRGRSAEPVRRVRHAQGGDRSLAAGAAGQRLSGDGVPAGAHRRAGLGAAQSGGAFQRGGVQPDQGAARNWRCPISGSRRCITSMPRTWRSW